MKLESIQRITKIDVLKPLRGYKPLTTIKVSILNIPSQSELFLLSANLLYQARLIIDKEIESANGLSVDHYIYKAIDIMKITDDYQNKFIDYKELKQIKKDFKLNGLYE